MLLQADHLQKQISRDKMRDRSSDPESQPAMQKA